MGTLKDALEKAGLQGTIKQNERAFKPAKKKQKVEKFQEQRNYCEVCFAIWPDVERYKHRNPTVDAEWICINCADKNEIPDECRMTNQSDFAKKGTLRRDYGATKKFPKK
jgi:hypothetical protein